MNNQNHGQHWQQRGQYGYQNPAQYQGTARQPMVVIPQRSPDELMQFYNSQTNYSQAQLFPPQGQASYPPQSQFPNHGYSHGYHPQMHHMPQSPQVSQMHMQQMQYNQHMYQGNFNIDQQPQSRKSHHAQSPSFVPAPPTLASQSQRSSSQSQPYVRPEQVQSRSASQSIAQVRQEQPKDMAALQSSHQLKTEPQRRQSGTHPNFEVKKEVASSRHPSMTTSQQVPRSVSSQPPQDGSQPRKIPQVVIPAKKQSAASNFAQAFAPPAKLPKLPKAVPKAAPVVAARSLDGVSDDDADYKLVLLSLAEQYISAARSMSTSLARTPSHHDVKHYHELMSLGLTCLDSAIENWKVGDTRTLVRLRLQYATLLFEETNDHDKAQSVLSQGITACERSKFLDQKCSMQHLLARIQFQSKPKAAFRIIDSALEDVTAYNNVVWTYAFRFLRVALALQLQRNNEVPATLQQLKQLIALSQSQGDITVLAMAHILEAEVHLRTGSIDAVEQAQRAIAAAQSHQLHPSFEKIPQLTALALFADLCCDLAIDKLDQLNAKVTKLQSFIDRFGGDEKSWLSSNFYLPTSVPTTGSILEDTSGIVRKTADGKASITFRWLNKNELFMLGFLLSGAARLQQNCIDERAEHYLSEGISYAKKGSVDTKTSTKSLEAACASVAREQSISLIMHIYRTFAHAIRSNWAYSNTSLQEIYKDFSEATIAEHAQILRYLEGVIKQGHGDLKGAIASYSAPELTLPATFTNKTYGPDHELRLVAAINRVMILKSSPQTNAEGDTVLHQILPVSQRHHSMSIRASVNLLQAMQGADLPVIELKKFLQTSLSMAQGVQNQQLISLLLNVMTVRFFKSIVGQQAEKSASVSWQISRKMRSPMWVGVSGQNLADNLRLQGKNDEAQKIQWEADKWFGKTPELIRKRYGDWP